MNIDLEKPYQDMCKKQESFEIKLEEYMDNTWFLLQKRQYAEKFIHDYECDCTPELLMQIARKGIYETRKFMAELEGFVLHKSTKDLEKDE